MARIQTILFLGSFKSLKHLEGYIIFLPSKYLDRQCVLSPFYLQAIYKDQCVSSALVLMAFKLVYDLT